MTGIIEISASLLNFGKKDVNAKQIGVIL